MLKPQDIMIALKLITMHGRDWKYSEAALELNMSPSEVHSGIKRLKKCSLVTELVMGSGVYVQKMHLPDIKSIKDFIYYGIRHVFPAVIGEPVKGLPTSFGVEHLYEGFEHNYPLIPVWEYPGGDYTGVSFKPIYSSAPQAGVNDFTLYQFLALTDSMRMDDANVRHYSWQKLNLMIGE